MNQSRVCSIWYLKFKQLEIIRIFIRLSFRNSILNQFLFYTKRRLYASKRHKRPRLLFLCIIPHYLIPQLLNNLILLHPTVPDMMIMASC